MTCLKCRKDAARARDGAASISILTCLLALSMQTGCGRLADPPAPAGASVFAHAWNWLDFPRADRLVLAQGAAVIEPAKMEAVKAPREGWFELSPRLQGIKNQDEAVSANQPIGSMAPGTESLEIEGEALRAQLTEVEDQLRKVREEEAAETFLEQERKARQDIKTYEAALALAADPALRRDLVPGAELASPEEIRRMEARLQAAKERLEKNRAAGEKQAALQKRQAELTEAKAAFERKQKTERDQVKAPFAGQIRFAITFEKAPEVKEKTGSAGAVTASTPPSAGQQKQTVPVIALRSYVRADTLVGVLRDQSAFWAKVEMEDAGLLSVPAKDLLFSFVSGPQTVEAPFAGRAPENAGGGRSTPIYQFGIETPSSDIVRLAGGVVGGKLVQKLPQTAYIVPKMRLLIHRSDAFADGAWEKNCARVFPGCRVLAVGRDAVALVPGDAPSTVASEASANEGTAKEAGK